MISKYAVYGYLIRDERKGCMQDISLTYLFEVTILLMKISRGRNRAKVHFPIAVKN